MNPIWIPSPHFHVGRKGYQPEAIVIHIAEGSRAAVDSWFTNPESMVSAHYLVCTDGSVHHYVREANQAFHAGRVLRPTWSLLKRDADEHPINPNLYTIGIEHEGQANDPWTPVMYATSASLIAQIAKRYDIPIDRAHLPGHREIFAAKTCPGSQVDLDHLVALASVV